MTSFFSSSSLFKMPSATVTALVPVRLASGHGHRRVKLAPGVTRRQFVRRPEGDGAQGHRLLGAVDDLGHVLQVHRFALVHSHQEVGHLVGGL